MKSMLGSMAVSLCVLLTGSIGCNECKDVVLSQVPSPDGKWVATQMTRDCGGLGGEIVGVSIHSPANAPSWPEDSVFVVKVLGPIGVTWQGSERLVINCNCQDSNIRQKRTRLQSVEIIYKTR